MSTALNLPLKFNHMRLVAAIAEHGQIGLAAHALSLTQPAASRMLAEIEALTRARLFTRHPRGLEPTELGRVFVRRAQAMLTEMRDMLQELEEVRAGDTGVASAGAVTGGAMGYLVPAIHALKAMTPSAEITVDVSPSDQLIRDLLAGKLDFALARIPPGIEAREFDIYKARTERVDLLVRRGHPLTGRRIEDLAELRDCPWVIQASGTPIRQAVEAAFHNVQVEMPRDVTNTPSLLVMLAMIASSDSICPVASEVTELLTGPTIAGQFAVLEIPEAIVVSPYYLLSIRKRQLSPVAERLKTLVLAELERAPGAGALSGLSG